MKPVETSFSLLTLLLSAVMAYEVPSETGSARKLWGRHKQVKDLTASPYLTWSNSHFGPNIEGMSLNPSGSAFAVNYGDATTNFQLGQVFPVQKLIYSDPVLTAALNGLQFQNERTAYVVDENTKRLLKLVFNSKGMVKQSHVYCSDPRMLPLNDLTISRKSGLIFLSAMNWNQTSGNTDGEIWVCSTKGQAKRLEVMGRVNGIALSPDENILYATESYTTNWEHVAQKIWKFAVDHTSATISNKRLFVDFEHVPGDSVKIHLDGIRTDKNGSLMAVRNGGSQVAVFTKQGKLSHRVHLNIKNPTNLAIGENGVFVCGQCQIPGRGCVDTFEWPCRIMMG